MCGSLSPFRGGDHLSAICLLSEWSSPTEGGKDVIVTKVRKNESLDTALKRFKRQCIASGVFQEVRKRARYQKPSVRRNLKAQAARKRKKRK